MEPHTDTLSPSRIVRVGTLAAFLAEAPTGAIVRLMQTHRQHECFRMLFLHVQALTAMTEVVWLCETHEIMCWQDGGPAGGQDRQLADGMQQLHDDLQAHLARLGFKVRDGTDFGLPDAVKPVSGHIGCWSRNADGALVTKLDTPDAASG
jgi:hypothetical protein